MRLNKSLVIGCIACGLGFFNAVSWSCTGLQLKAKDGAVVNGRTVEFGMPLDLSALVVPRNYEFRGTLPDGAPGLSYRSKYAAVGANTFGEDSIVDGLNEKGLAAAMFYFPLYAEYTAVTKDNQKSALSPSEFTNWILTQFATVEEVKLHLNDAVIVPTIPKGWGVLPPLHYIVYDKTGQSITIEPLKGKLVVYDNPIGVITNSPTFDWHVTNLSNYINLTPLNAPSVNIDGLKLQAFGQGSGLHGLPGDFSPPSRFIRAAIFSSTAVPSETVQQTVFQAFHILNQFDIPVGAVRSDENGKVENEATIATTVRNPNELKFYFRTYDDQSIRMIDLNAFDLNSSTIKYISMKGETPVEDMSKSAAK